MTNPPNWSIEFVRCGGCGQVVRACGIRLSVDAHGVLTAVKPCGCEATIWRPFDADCLGARIAVECVDPPEDQ